MLCKADNGGNSNGYINIAGNITTNGGQLLTVKTSVAADAITGSGGTAVSGSLTADSIVQDALTIGAGGSVTIRPTTGAANAVPEPGTWALLGIGLLSLLAFRRRRRRVGLGRCTG